MPDPQHLDGARRIALPGLDILLQPPRAVAEGAGRCWFPDLLRFPAGQLMLNYSLNPDSNENDVNAQAVLISDDGGASWPFAYDVNGFHNAGGEIRMPLDDGSIVGIGTLPIKPDPPGQWRRVAAHYWRYDLGGRRYTVEPWAAHIDGLPRDIAPYPNRSRVAFARANPFSEAVPLCDGRYLATCSLHYEGDRRESTIAMVSGDLGRTWHYLSTIAGEDDVPDAVEGFDEPCLVRLADGDLMCVSRVGSGRDQRLARSYSNDEGRTWSPIDRLPAFSVAPCIRRLANEVLVLSTGRPGIYLWLSTDDRGRDWQPVDVVAHHNAVLPPEHRINVEGEGRPAQTTSYTALVETEPGRVLMVYDRVPFGWEAVPAESSERARIYLLEMAIRPLS